MAHVGDTAYLPAKECKAWKGELLARTGEIRSPTPR